MFLSAAGNGLLPVGEITEVHVSRRELQDAPRDNANMQRNFVVASIILLHHGRAPCRSAVAAGVWSPLLLLCGHSAAI